MKKINKLCAILLASSLMFSQGVIANAALPNFTENFGGAKAEFPTDLMRAYEEACANRENLPPDMQRLHDNVSHYVNYLNSTVNSNIYIIEGALSSTCLTDEERQSLNCIRNDFVKETVAGGSLLRDVYRVFPVQTGSARQDLYVDLLNLIKQHVEVLYGIIVRFNKIEESIRPRLSAAGVEFPSVDTLVVETDRNDMRRVLFLSIMIANGAVQTFESDDTILRGTMEIAPDDQRSEQIIQMFREKGFTIYRLEARPSQVVALQINTNGQSGNGFNGGFVAGLGNGKKFF